MDSGPFGWYCESVGTLGKQIIKSGLTNKPRQPMEVRARWDGLGMEGTQHFYLGGLEQLWLEHEVGGKQRNGPWSRKDQKTGEASSSSKIQG